MVVLLLYLEVDYSYWILIHMPDPKVYNWILFSRYSAPHS